ncbi:hypothetical protein [Dactylosporangium sp. CA-233914]|uniref:hypothetical protein n=1 Tax=Dactylosporangium sp. CA-233914 TaxID=3239934 RepID=UPI003D8AC2C4
MTDIEHTEFTRKYVDLLVKVWRDEDEHRRLVADPTAYAIEAGLPVAPGDVVVLDRSQLEHLPTRTDVMSKWDEGATNHVLVVPETPLIDTAELSEAELDLAAAVADNNVSNNISLCLFAETN